MKLYLASKSKFKSQILDKVYINHECIDVNVKEESTKTNAHEYVMELAKLKARHGATMVSDGLILGLDTVVLMNGKIIEKPKTLEEAKENLRKASNNKVSVLTGISLINLDTEEAFTDFQETKVIMNEISEENINYYIEKEKDALYVSGFVIETVASCFIQSIEGSYYNILGLPVEKFYQLLRKMNLDLKDID